MNLLEVFQNSEDVEDYPAETVIISEGDSGNRMYIVVNGKVDISLKGRNIGAVLPGGIVGEMALLNSDVRSATATAQTDCKLALIDQSSFKLMLEHVPEFALHVMLVLATRLHGAYLTVKN
jgi:CRP/FNR family cyclic AMP-dependent transcriptional regulator